MELNEIDGNTGSTVLFGTSNEVKILDSILDFDPEKQFSIDDLSQYTRVDEKMVRNRIQLFDKLDILENVDEDSNLYKFNTDSEISELLIRIDGDINSKGQEINS